MTDPYRVLGVSPDANNDEIKKAYRTLSRQYHPDANIGNPNKDAAEEKFKEVQAAYNQIMADRERGYSDQNYGGYSQYGNRYSGQSGYGGQSFTGGGYGYGYGNYGYGFNGGFGQNDRNAGFENEDELKFRAATNYLNSGSYAEALKVLESIDTKDGRWYYLSAIANARTGNNAIALEYARTACSLEPNNMMYRQLLSQLQSGGQWYQDMGQSYGMPNMVFTSNCWSTLCFLTACNCCCPGSCCYVPMGGC